MQDIHEGLNFASDARGDVFGLWSLQFSEDGRELVAGSNDKCIYVYDLEANKPVLRIHAHKVRFSQHRSGLSDWALIFISNIISMQEICKRTTPIYLVCISGFNDLGT